MDRAVDRELQMAIKEDHELGKNGTESFSERWKG